MSFTKAVTSTAIIAYEPPEAQIERSIDLAMKKSFKTQVADAKWLNSISVQGAILAGTAITPQNSPTLPKPFKGTRAELLDKITPTVHQTLNDLDYDGLQPYLKVIDQLNAGKNIREITIDSQEEEYGSTCVGMSHALIKSLKEKHHVEGMLAVQRKGSNEPFEHGAVIVQCSDGFVLLDPRSDPNTRIFSIPFESTARYGNLSLTASKPGSRIPLRMIYAPISKYPEVRFEYATGVANGDDIVMKRFVMDACDFFIPIACYKSDGSPRKHIKIYFNQSKIEFFDNKDCIDTISFEEIQKGGLLSKLSSFMEPNDYCTLSRFHLPVESVHQQLVQFVSNQQKLKELISQTSLGRSS